MNFDWSTLALQTINFAVLAWLLHRFLYKPVLRLIDARRTDVERQYKDAAAADARAKAELQRVEAERFGLAKEREQSLKEAASQTERLAEERRAKAQQEANALIAVARQTIADERTRARAETRNAALDLGVEIAQRLLAEVPAELRAEAWLEHIERHFAALTPAERDELRDGAASGASLRVVTATNLPDQTKAEWCTRLRRSLGNHVDATFEVDSTLVAGAELHFPTTILRLSWQSALADMRAEINADTNAR
jgi:F-type H+-transporting ATPase subunit b